MPKLCSVWVLMRYFFIDGCWWGGGGVVERLKTFSIFVNLTIC